MAAEAGRPYAERLNAVMASLASKVVVGPNSPKLLAGTGSDQMEDVANSALNGPGSTTVTLVPKPATSCARESESPSTAAFEAV